MRLLTFVEPSAVCQWRGKSRGSVVLVVMTFLLVAPAFVSAEARADVDTAATSTTLPASAFAALPAAEQSNISPYPVLQRLGRWDGTTFQPVAAGSLPPGNLVVMSHGWAPGYLDSYLQLQLSSPTLVTLWTAGLVDTSGRSSMDIWGPTAQALQAGDPTSTVMMFSWVDQSATADNPFEARNPEQATEVNGHRLATAVDKALAPNFQADGGQVHLIGHSFGASVATTAALSLAVAPRQLTLLDSPETKVPELAGAKNNLRYKLPRLDIGRGPGQTFVDNYVSYVGMRYSTFPGLEAIVDVQTAPPPDAGPAAKHEFAVVWYRSSAQDASADVGVWWSPLIGGNVASLGTFYSQPDPADPLALDEIEGPPLAGVNSQLLLPTTDLVVPGPSVTLGRETTTWNLTFSTDEQSFWLDFDLRWAGAPGDEVSVFVDGRQRYQAALPVAGTGSPGAFLALYDVAPGNHVMSVVLSGPSATGPPAAPTTAVVSGLQLTSATGIQRNYTEAATNRLAAVVLIGALVISLTIVIGVIAALVYLVVRLVRRRRRRRDSYDVDTTSVVPPPPTPEPPQP